MKTGRVAAVAEEQRRQWIAEGRAPADAFWVRNRRNTGLVLVSPNPDPDAPDAIRGGEGAESVVGQAENVEDIETSRPADTAPEPGDPLAFDAGDDQPVSFDYPDIPLALKPDSAKTVLSDGTAAPVVNLEKDRIANILADEPAIFEMADSPTVTKDVPWYALHNSGYWAVWVRQDVIENEARVQEVDPDLIKAIVYVENAHGASYGWIPESIGVEKTTLPMNINLDTWGRLVGAEKGLDDPLVNVRAGISLIRRIQQRIENPTVAKLASPYKFTGREQVSDYGARVAQVYKTRAWEKVPSGFANPKLNQTPARKAYLEEFQRRREELERRLPDREAE